MSVPHTKYRALIYIIIYIYMQDLPLGYTLFTTHTMSIDHELGTCIAIKFSPPMHHGKVTLTTMVWFGYQCRLTSKLLESLAGAAARIYNWGVGGQAI